MNRSLVKRSHASKYILMMVVTFAATVVITRYYLEWTGYPQIGGGELHIAHLLWGGLALFIAGLLPLIFANRRTYDWAAVLSGVGVGLFIDEVGKFITKTNDYFYPAAAPIIYGVFLLTVLLYFELRAKRSTSARSEMYAVLDELPLLINHTLTAPQLAQLKNRLGRVNGQQSDTALAHLAGTLQKYLESEPLDLIEAHPGLLGRLRQWFTPLWKRYVPQNRHRNLIVIGLGIPGLFSLLELLLLALLLLFPTATVEFVARTAVAAGQIDSLNNLLWFAVRFWLDGFVGLLAVAGAILLLKHKDKAGTNLGVVSLVLSLTVNNLLTFYLDQFRALTYTLIQFVILLLVITYRRWYLQNDHALDEVRDLA